MKQLLSAALETLHWTLLALWFGGLVVFSALVAPAAFRVLPSTELAGNLVGSVLTKLYILGTIVGVLLIVTANGLRSRGLFGAGRSVLLLLCLVVSLAANVYAQWGIAPRVAELRRAVPAIGSAPATDPLKQEFDRMHQRSVQMMGLNILALLVAIALSRRSEREAGVVAPPAPSPTA